MKKLSVILMLSLLLPLRLMHDITAPWIEILIPSYEWKNKEPQYGWVFGGYLSKEQPEFIKPRTKDEFIQFLESS